MGRFYKINPPCPHCHEEHIWWQIQLTDEEQAKMDEYVEENKGRSSISLLLGEPGIIVTRKLNVVIVEKYLRHVQDCGKIMR